MKGTQSIIRDGQKKEAQRRKEFNTPPKYREDQYATLFEISVEAEEYLESLILPQSQLSFLMAYAYCKATSRFYSTSTYHKGHMTYAAKAFKTLSKVRSLVAKTPLKTLRESLGGKIYERHKRKVRELLAKSEMSHTDKKELSDYAQLQAEKQTGPELLMESLKDYCFDKNWIMPSYDYLFTLIGKRYSSVEKQATMHVAKYLPESIKSELLSWIDVVDGQSRFQQLKTINPSHKARALQNKASIVNEISRVFHSASVCIDKLNLNDQSIDYYAKWAINATSERFAQLRDKDKQCLHLLTFVVHTFFARQDAGWLGFKKAFTADKTRAKSRAYDKFNSLNTSQVHLIGQMVKEHDSLTQLAHDLILVADDKELSDNEKVRKMRTALMLVVNSTNLNQSGKVERLTDWANSQINDAALYLEMVENYDATYRKLAGTLRSLEFDPKDTDTKLYKAVKSFQEKRPYTNSYLEKKYKKIIENVKDETKKKKLSDILLFQSVVDGMKGGRLNLKYSFHFRRFQTYLIDDANWKSDKKHLINILGLSRFADFKKVRRQYGFALDEALEGINRDLDSGKNGYLEHSNGKPKVKKYRSEDKIGDDAFVSAIFKHAGTTTIQKVLRVVNEDVNFYKEFHHATNRYATRDVSPVVLEAGLIALGCNLGANKMLSSSKGVTEKPLSDCIKHRLSLDNLRRANQKIVLAINELPLAKIVKPDTTIEHTSSDGQKLLVLGDSLYASHSFKYFGQDKGVTRYITIDSNQRILYSRVFTASDYEAGYVLDSLVNNRTDLPHLHSTDTHGTSDPVFCCAPLMGIHYSPRIKNLEKSGIYSNRSRQFYMKKNYRIYPTRAIEWSKIESQWDKILRFVATILTGKSSASQLFKRLNSYSSQHPVYKAMAEFGKVERTLFILRYHRSLELRRRIQTQLNIAEQANKFTKAVCWGRGQRLAGTSLVGMDQHSVCTELLQNAVILWNYLYLSSKLQELKNDDAVQEEVDAIARSQMLAWSHINFTGTFEFLNQSSRIQTFDLKSLRRQKLPQPTQVVEPYEVASNVPLYEDVMGL